VTSKVNMIAEYNSKKTRSDGESISFGSYMENHWPLSLHIIRNLIQRGNDYIGEMDHKT